MRWGRRPLGRPLIIAHRGASADAPENTLRAFAAARAQGADGVELDVMRCGSGEVVVFHDDDLGRFGGGERERVRALPWDTLRHVDVGGGEHMPLLADALDALGPLLCNIELKSAPTWGARAVDDGLADEVGGLVRATQMSSRVLVSSFDPLLLWRFQRACPEVATGLLFGADQSRPLRQAWTAPLLRLRALHPEAALVDAVALAAWRDRGYAVNVWTVDDPGELRALAAIGVDGLITNRPAQARAVVYR